VLAPPGLLVDLTPVARAHVLLHELGHLRRRDLWVEALFTLAVALHWWNPLVWIALRLARADREVACDDWVLRRIGEHGAFDYGQSLLAVSAQWRRTEGVLLPVAMVEDRRGLRDRIRRIAFFRRRTWLRGFATGALVAGLGLTALADEPRRNIQESRWRGQSPPAGYESFRWIGAPDSVLPELPFARQESPAPSSGTAVRTAVLFENRTDEVVTIHWNDLLGRRRFYAALAPGEAHLQWTWLDHVWIVLGEHDQQLGVAVSQQTPGRVTIR
jgi:hypothetical protein